MTTLHATAFHQAVYRHARFYLNQLQVAHEHVYGEDPQQSLALFDEHWSQIDAAFRRLTHTLSDPESAALCNEYVRSGIELVIRWRPVSEHIEWLDAGVQAAQQAGDQEREIDCLNGLGQAYLIGRSLDQSVAVYSRALEMAHGLGYLKQEADALVGLGRNNILNPIAIETARAQLKAAEKIYRDLDDRRGRAWSLHQLATLEDINGSAEAAQTYATHALEIFQQLGDRRLVGVAYGRLGSIAEREKNYVASLAWLEKAVAIAREIDDSTQIVRSLNTMGLVKGLQGELLACRAYLEEALPYSYKTGNKLDIGKTLLNLGWAASDLEDYEAALIYHRQAMDLYGSMNFERRVANELTTIGFIETKLGRLEQAESKLKQALAFCLEHGPVNETIDVLIGFAWLDLLQGDAARGARLIGMALARPPEVPYPERDSYLKWVRPEFEAVLPSEELARYLEEGRALDPEKEAERVLQSAGEADRSTRRKQA